MWIEPRARLGLRLKEARERAGLTQQQLAAGLGLKHGQIVGRMEDGRRSIAAPELIRAMDILGVDLDYFTDPFHLEGEGEFTFRTDPGVPRAVVDGFEEQAGRWIAMYRELSAEQGRKPRWLELKLALSPRSSVEDAEDAGEAFADQMELGDCPATALRSVMERRLGIPVLDVDAPPRVAAAACRARGVRRTYGVFHLHAMNCVLINRRGSEGWRNFDLAYQLFHLLTWDAMPPRRTESVDVPDRGKGGHLERLAEAFAYAVLMPWPLVRQHWKSTPAADALLADRRLADKSLEEEWLGVLHAGTDRFRVSRAVYTRRLADLFVLSREQVHAIERGMRSPNGRHRSRDGGDGSRDGGHRSRDGGMPIQRGRPCDPAAKTPLFSREFAGCVAVALETERLSPREAASVLNLSLPELATLLEGYGHEVDSWA